jgi:hypothetical protein
MPNAIDTYVSRGAPEPAQMRRAAAWDLGLVTVVFAILWPTPAMRLTVGLPWSVHVPVALASLAVVWWLYAVVCARLLRRTVGMYLADVGFAEPDGTASLGRVLRWALGWAAALVPAVLGARGVADPERGWAARLSGLTLASTRAPA